MKKFKYLIAAISSLVLIIIVLGLVFIHNLVWIKTDIEHNVIKLSDEGHVYNNCKSINSEIISYF